MFDMEQAGNSAPNSKERAKPKAGLPAGCSECRGRPWVAGERGARRCACDRGRVLAAKDSERGKP